MPERDIEEVLRDRTGEWMEIPGVVGTGQGRCDGEPCLKVFVSDRTPEVEERVPEEADGYQVRVEVTGEFRPREP